MSAVPTNVIEYFAREHTVDRTAAEAVFVELDNFLGAAARTSQRPSKMLDEAWHAFILHTREYAEYCSSRFGRFVHHVPYAIDLDATDGGTASCSKCSSSCDSE